MLQRSALSGRPQRPIFQEVRQLSDAQLSLMCHSHRIFPGPITFQNRRHAERQLHIALIEERARLRARQQFAEECRKQHSENARFRPITPPPQQHYDITAAFPEPAAPSPNYWPMPRTVNLRNNPPPSSGFRYHPEPVLEPRRYVTWQQQDRIYQLADQKPAEADGTDINFLGFKLPFSLETAKEISTKIGDTLKRFQGVGESQTETRFEGGAVQHRRGKYEERFHDGHRKTETVARQRTQQSSYSIRNTYDRCKDASEDEYQADESEEEMSDEDQDTLFDHWEEERQQSFDFQEPKTPSHAEAQTELVERSSHASSSTTYHDFFSQEPMKPAAGSFWWWWPQRARAGDERIPEAEQTRETEHMHEHEVKSIDYLRGSSLQVDDGVMELMQRVDLRDDSEEEDLVVLPDGSLSTRPLPRTYAGFCRSIFRWLLCDRNANLDPEKLRCAFLGCCMAFAIYMGIRMIR
ncbi:hypothetical protein KR054_012588 [Drosophila jambulina]|nr:hypothetical protein KR054_012588 [Drosophila jambulina]